MRICGSSRGRSCRQRCQGSDGRTVRRGHRGSGVRVVAATHRGQYGGAGRVDLPLRHEAITSFWSVAPTAATSAYREGDGDAVGGCLRAHTLVESREFGGTLPPTAPGTLEHHLDPGELSCVIWRIATEPT